MCTWPSKSDKIVVHKSSTDTAIAGRSHVLKPHMRLHLSPQLIKDLTQNPTGKSQTTQHKLPQSYRASCAERTDVTWGHWTAGRSACLPEQPPTALKSLDDGFSKAGRTAAPSLLLVSVYRGLNGLTDPRSLHSHMETTPAQQPSCAHGTEDLQAL